MHRFRFTVLRAALATGLFAVVWLIWTFAVGGNAIVDLVGWTLLYGIGLVWTVYLVEQSAQGYEARKVKIRPLNWRDAGTPYISVGGEVRRNWSSSNPLDPGAWYYGRSAQRLRQSLAMLAAYSILFVLVYILAHWQFGSKNEGNEYESPMGGGTDSIKASSVKVQKVVRKKYVINPYSSIVFAAPPPIDQIELKLNEETANQYKAGKGEGGLGDGEGEGGGYLGGTGKGKIRFIRLRHSDKSWDKNFGIGGDRNLLAELVVREPKMRGKVADETEAIDIATLGTFPHKKSPPLVYVGGAQTFAPSPADKKVLKQYLVERHGMILGDNLGGQGFHNSFFAVMNEVTGVSPVPIPIDDRIHLRPYSMPQLPLVVAHGGRVAWGWKLDGRWAVYYHPGALSDAWRDDRAGIKKDIAELCYQLGINIIDYSHREYGRWVISQP